MKTENQIRQSKSEWESIRERAVERERWTLVGYAQYVISELEWVLEDSADGDKKEGENG